LPFLGMYVQQIHTVWMYPLSPWLATCTCGVWQVDFLCQEKGPQGMTVGWKNLTPSFSPMQSQDFFLPLNTVEKSQAQSLAAGLLWEEGWKL
jgi:hypothetical protein